MSEYNSSEAMACPIGEVLISRLTEIKEMIDDYKQIKAHKPSKGQESFVKEQSKLYEDQFEACMDDLLLKLEVADKALEALSRPSVVHSSKDVQQLALKALNSLRE
ncbi:hypothetical protein EHS13_06420 [Paenibacillus psychroresistens]|uniref:Uncharacterized protein n=1 Tax=Paenibacillus psychroresistens TaxID=1778678 RepID=A0A6B8RG92_9BACL|nr:hypothetical protein [Paenibacillus psychroresistens]QGQ94543.1 hypothetical protein EHS13_06420 [Paenibacillus psychroresistens]